MTLMCYNSVGNFLTMLTDNLLQKVDHLNFPSGLTFRLPTKLPELNKEWLEEEEFISKNIYSHIDNCKVRPT